jgi:hypothetical protein
MYSNTNYRNNTSMGRQNDGNAVAVRSLLVAAVATIALYFIPYAGYVTYPIRMLVTFVHEGSHALMSLLTGGSVASISIQPDGSGLTQSYLYGWLPQILVASAGYLGASLYGAAIIGFLRRGVSAKRLLIITAVAIGLATTLVLKGLIFSGNIFGLVWGVLLTAGLMLAALRLPKDWANWLTAFIGVQCVLNAFYDLHTLFALSVSSGAATDAMGMARLTLIPAPVWAGIWMLTALIMLAFVLRPARTPALARVALR